MRANQRETLSWLRRKAPSLADLYEGAVRMLNDRSFPGRLRFIAHAVREIRNRLPEIIAGRIVQPNLNYKDQLEPMVSEWKATHPLGVVVQNEEHKQSPLEQTVHISRKLAQMLDDLVRKHQETSLKKKDKARVLMMALVPENKEDEKALIPVVNHWIDVTEWFVTKAHEQLNGPAADEDELVHRFGVFETSLAGFVRHLFSGLDDIEETVTRTNASAAKPNLAEVEKVVSLFVRPQLRRYFFERLKNAHWLQPLKNKGCFGNPPEPTQQEGGWVSYTIWPEGHYLKVVASKVPSEVVDIVISVKTTNPFAVKDCIEALVHMPVNEAVKGIGFVRTHFKEIRRYDWFIGGQQAAHLMAKLAGTQTCGAFSIAGTLLDIWKSERSERSTFSDINAKFTAFEYKDLVFKYYNKLYAVDALRAARLLVKIFSGYLEAVAQDGNDDGSIYLHWRLENLDEIDRLDRDIVAILVKGICEAGEAVIEKQPEKVDRLLEELRNRGKEIFDRIEMYLLRHVPLGSQKERVNAIIEDRRFLDEYGYRNEYKLLLRDRFDDMTDVAKKVFLGWVEERKVQDEYGKQLTKEDIRKHNSSFKAQELFLLKEQFPELYKSYQEQSGRSDDELAPRPMGVRAEFIDPQESSPRTQDELLSEDPDKVLEYVSNSEKWERAEKSSPANTPKEALGAVFEKVVVQRPSDYINLALEKIAGLEPTFLMRYFCGLLDALQEKKVESNNWKKILAIVGCVVTRHGKAQEYRSCLQVLLSVVEKGLDKDAVPMEVTKENLSATWQIVTALVRYCHNPDAIADREADPFTESMNCVKGKAVGLAIRLALKCKNELPSFYEESIGKEQQEVLGYVLDEVKEAKINCVLGVWFPQLCWMNEEWVKANLDKIFDEKSSELWPAVWGSYISWGRASPQAFGLLAERGKYGYAIEQLGSTRKYNYGKDPEEGLIEHLMIAFFNGWVESEDDRLLKAFLKKASPKLRGHAAWSLTTGFKHLRETPDKKTIERLKRYWESRLETITRDPSGSIDETVEFTGWVKNSPLETSATFDLLYKTLELTGGKIGERRDVVDFIEGICEVARGHELMALRCINRATSEQKMGMNFTLYEDELTEFMVSVVQLPDSYPNILAIRKEAMSLADAYGRMHIYKFRRDYEVLSKKIERQT